MTNILDAISNIVQQKNFELLTYYEGRNRANSMGKALEEYVKDAFSNTFKVQKESERIKIHSNEFSWLGSQNNPPDIMIKGGDAIEVKKIQSQSSHIALNSSYPKSNLHIDNPMITSSCRESENWTQKELIYCIGNTSDTRLNSLWMIYGSIYAASDEIYNNVKKSISKGIRNIPDIVFSETKELGRVNSVDPLGITSLRIRGMWQIENPKHVFNYLHKSSNENFELICIIPDKIFLRFTQTSKDNLQLAVKNGLTVEDVHVKNPNNPAKLEKCKLCKFITPHPPSA